MATKRTHLSAFAALLLLLVQEHYAYSVPDDCGVKREFVDLKGAHSPIVLMYQDARERHLLKIHHPDYFRSDCLIHNYYSDGGLVSLACLQHQLQFPGLDSWPANVSTTSLIVERRAMDDTVVIAPEHPSPISFKKLSAAIKCSGAVEPTMKKLSDNKYQVGYQMNALDFLSIFYLEVSDQSTFTYAKILPIINRRPRIDDSKEILRKGHIFKHLPVAFSQLDRKIPLSPKMERILKSKLSSNASAGNNYLVYGQLLSKDDVFYIPEQRATFFLENSALIWNSVNEGNWKKVGDIVRRVAYETVTPLDVYSGTLQCLTVDNTPVYLDNMSNSTKPMCVPKFLFKIALDRRYDLKRQIVFITVNDPSVKVARDGSIPSDFQLCPKKSECDQLYPEFSSPQKGYTYCCDLKDFQPWDEIRQTDSITTMPLHGPYIRPPQLQPL